MVASLTVTEVDVVRSHYPVPNKGDMMVKVLIYSSKKIYDTAPFEGRAEANFVAYRRDDGYYEIVKNRSGFWFGSVTTPNNLAHQIRMAENEEWEREIKDYKLCQEMKNHPYIELMKNTAGIV